MALQLTRLTFQAAPDAPGEPSPVTVIVGPNNSGKSLALREIADWARGSDEPRQVVRDLDVEWPADESGVSELLAPYTTDPQPNETPPPDSYLVETFRIGDTQNRSWIQRNHIASQLQIGSSSTYLREGVLSRFTAYLNGRARFALTEQQPWQDQQLPPQHHLAALFFDDALRARVRDIVAEAFPGRYFVIDPTGMQNLRIRMSSRPPADPAEERNWDGRAQAFHAAADPVSELSDGVICFTGLVAAVVSLPHRILLVDEPEAFLHPPLARLLGSSLATLSAERRANLVVATHSAELLMGCIESGIDTTIVRVTYESGEPGARVLTPGDLRPLIVDPLLRSTRALQGLFHRGVIVGESDHDRAFYEEINRRLRTVRRGAPDTYFTNAQNWQTIPRVIGPLRALGVPAAATLDLDTLTGQKAEWKKFYDAIGLHGHERQELEECRVRVAGHLRSLGRDGDRLKCKKSGLRGLGASQRQEVVDLIERLDAHGLFVVQVGELERWLPRLGVGGSSKARWIVDMFRALGSNPSAASYVPPGRGNVWAYVDRIGSWVDDPNRLGM